jgi:hypothetical protein
MQSEEWLPRVPRNPDEHSTTCHPFCLGSRFLWIGLETAIPNTGPKVYAVRVLHQARCLWRAISIRVF